MSLSELKNSLKAGLSDAYKPRQVENASCAICGNTTGPFSLHLIEYDVQGPESVETGVPMSRRQRGKTTENTRGSLPICTKCAPACKKCGLPLPTEKVLDYLESLKRGSDSRSIRAGLGYCQDFHFGFLLQALWKRIFRLGRFGQTMQASSLVLGRESQPNFSSQNTKPDTGGLHEAHPTLMSPDEIHDFGIEIVTKDARKMGYKIISINNRLGHDPQIVAEKNGKTFHVLVRTACYPSKGELDEGALGILSEKANSQNSGLLFASVGIANANGKTDSEMGQCVRGAGFYVSYQGMKSL